MRIEEFVQTQQSIGDNQLATIMLTVPGYHVFAKMSSVTVMGLGKESSGLLQIIDKDGLYWYLGVSQILAIRVDVNAKT